MGENDETTGGAARLELPVQADIRQGAEIQAWCRAALETGGDATIDCGSVERVDAAVLQCLVALATGLRAGGRRLQLMNPSPGFTRAVDLLGLGPQLS